MRYGVILLAVVFAFTLPAEAAVITTTRANIQALPGADFVDWGVLGAPFSNPGNPFNVLSNGGLSIDVSKPSGGSFERRDQNTGWSGNFAPGAKLLWTNNTVGPAAVMTFGGQGVSAAGAQIQRDLFGLFTATVEIFSNNVSLGLFNFNGNSTSAGDNSAIFVGLESTTPFDKIEFNVTGQQDFAINRFDFAVVPEPASLALLGVAGAFVLWRRRRK